MFGFFFFSNIFFDHPCRAPIICRVRLSSLMLSNFLYFLSFLLIFVFSLFHWVVYTIMLSDLLILGHLGDSVSWVPPSWFWLRSWSKGHGIEHYVGCCTEHGACLRFSLSSCSFPACVRACACAHTPSLSLSQIKNNKSKKTNLLILSSAMPVLLLSPSTVFSISDTAGFSGM